VVNQPWQRKHGNHVQQMVTSAFLSIVHCCLHGRLSAVDRKADHKQAVQSVSCLVCACVMLPGGAFMAGHPLMYKPAYKLWMQQLAEQGIHMRILAGVALASAAEGRRCLL
jgi:hypothetical protein